MKNRKKVINIILITFILIGVFLIARFDLFKRIEDSMVIQVDERKASFNNVNKIETKYETCVDEEGNEVVIEFEKKIGVDEEGNEYVFWEDTAEPEIIYVYTYKGTIEKIEDNKIYFIVDKKSKENSYFCSDVNDYQIVLSNYKNEVERYGEFGFSGSLIFDYESYSNVEDLKFAVGEYLRLQVSEFKDPHTSRFYKHIYFYLK